MKQTQKTNDRSFNENRFKYQIAILLLSFNLNEF
jgi:hypothetical protein